MNEMNVNMVSNIQRALGIIEGATYHIEKPVADIITHAIDMIEESVKNVQIVETHGAYPTREVIYADWYDRLSTLEYVYNPNNDGPWYRAEDVWACIDPAQKKEVDNEQYQL